ncbi:hypothetical protein BJ684DRAFT_14800 [Piptocephalis cylindrospora]|uniref:Mid2 domain-containing protein n=1 Tax=Piptocephalis cylindrospora TaxID=1907219 RepID=A0A4P9Y817_9FUNG|nr:hypothetical protein BJ684DRAFT_14800 [Piptocephalis cylindrospora]|eukprot:RKP14914.1 hypothetical protein BJ684DRAFT_14800 [Piptocephalis cylindrospora]
MCPPLSPSRSHERAATACGHASLPFTRLDLPLPKAPVSQRPGRAESFPHLLPLGRRRRGALALESAKQGGSMMSENFQLKTLSEWGELIMADVGNPDGSTNWTPTPTNGAPAPTLAPQVPANPEAPITVVVPTTVATVNPTVVVTVSGEPETIIQTDGPGTSAATADPTASPGSKDASSDDGGSTSNKTIIIATVVPIVSVILIAAVVAFFFIRRRRAAAQRRHTSDYHMQREEYVGHICVRQHTRWTMLCLDVYATKRVYLALLLHIRPNSTVNAYMGGGGGGGGAFEAAPSSLIKNSSTGSMQNSTK